MKLAANGVGEAQGLIGGSRGWDSVGGTGLDPPPAWLSSLRAGASSSSPGEGGKGHRGWLGESPPVKPKQSQLPGSCPGNRSHRLRDGHAGHTKRDAASKRRCNDLL